MTSPGNQLLLILTGNQHYQHIIVMVPFVLYCHIAWGLSTQSMGYKKHTLGSKRFRPLLAKQLIIPPNRVYGCSVATHNYVKYLGKYDVHEQTHNNGNYIN